MEKAGVPVLPYTPDGVSSFDDAKAIAAEIGYPVIVKASAGGGGIGMQIVENEAGLKEAIEKGMRIAKSAFGDETVFIEKYLVKPRHIEFQVLADKHGNRIHLFDRECSIQRRHQKLVEEAPSPIMTDELRERMADSALKVVEASDYYNAGTVEFLYTNGDFYFMEMNTRLQVEHTVTEMVTGIDLVRQQIAIAAGEKLHHKQEDVSLHGHAIECRINAEDPLNNFTANPGKIVRYRSPGGPGIRVDSGIHMGYSIPPYYDSMLSKLCAWGTDRTESIEHHAIMNNRHFIDGDTHTHFLSEGHIQNNLERYLREEETRMQTLGASLRRDKEAAAISAAISVYIQKSQ